MIREVIVRPVNILDTLETDHVGNVVVMQPNKTMRMVPRKLIKGVEVVLPEYIKMPEGEQLPLGHVYIHLHLLNPDNPKQDTLIALNVDWWNEVCRRFFAPFDPAERGNYGG